MKNNLKRIACTLMILVLAMSFTACGSKKSTSKDSKKEDTKVNANLAELTVADVLDKMAEASKDMTGAAFEADFVFDIEMSGEAIKVSADMTGETLTKDTVSSHVNMNMNMDYAGQSMEMPMEMYQIQDGDVMKMYMNMYETWTYQESDMSDMGVSLDMSQYEDMLKDVDMNEVLEYLDVAEVTTKDGNYVVDMEITLATIMDAVKESGLLDGQDVDLSILPEAALKVNFAVDGKTFLPETMTIVIEMDEFEMEGQTLAVNEFTIDMKYTSYEVDEIVVPEEAIASESTSSDFDEFVVEE